MYRLKQENDKWYIEAWTKEFDWIYLLKGDSLAPRDFNTRDEALNFLNDEILNIKRGDE